MRWHPQSGWEDGYISDESEVLAEEVPETPAKDENARRLTAFMRPVTMASPMNPW